MVIEFPGNDFIAGLRDEPALLLGELAEVTIHECGSLLEDAERADELGRHHVAANVEMDEGTGGLRAVIAVGGHLDGAHAVGFSASVHIGWVRNSNGGNVLSLFGVVRETGDDARTAFVGAVGVSPLQQHRHLVTEADEKNQMHAQPRQPRRKAGEFEPPHLRHRGGAANRCHRAFVPILKRRSRGFTTQQKLVFNQPRDMSGHLHSGR